MSALLLALAPALLPGPAAAAQDPPGRAPLEASLERVVLHPDGASVVRVATAPGPGAYVVPGLPASVEVDALRVRADGAVVAAAELRERLARAEDGPRVLALEARVEEREAAVAALADDVGVLDALDVHLARLLELEATDHVAALARGEAPVAAWGERLAWLRARTEEARAERREARARLEAARRELEAVRAELGRARGGDGRRVRDLHLDLVAGPGADGPVALEVEALVPGAGWAPVYDLRADRRLASVELVHRARVWQTTGEDWRDVELVLSTAAPRRSAAPPEPAAPWLDLARPAPSRKLSTLRYAGRPTSEVEEEAPELSAAVLDEGLSLRYRLPRPETIESRGEPTLVLVGRAELAVTAEHVAVPAVDETVYLRARTTNTSGWVLLPGVASVHLGADVVGRLALPTVRRGEELVLHLGPDPGVRVERAVLALEDRESGLFGSRRTRVGAWRIRVRNEGGLSPRPDGAVEVVVHEVLPEPTDDRISVDVEEASPRPATGERWDELRRRTGALTWVLRVPPGEERRVELRTEVAWPEDLELVER